MTRLRTNWKRGIGMLKAFPPYWHFAATVPEVYAGLRPAGLEPLLMFGPGKARESFIPAGARLEETRAAQQAEMAMTIKVQVAVEVSD